MPDPRVRRDSRNASRSGAPELIVCAWAAAALRCRGRAAGPPGRRAV